MDTKTIVILLQENSSNRGEVTSFDQPQDAERYLEGLLEAGFERRSIRVLAARDVELLITHKPVVSLHTAQVAPAVQIPEPAAVEVVQTVSEVIPESNPEPVYAEAMESHTERALVTVGAPAETDQSSEDEPYMRNGVRFSSAFASEY